MLKLVHDVYASAPRQETILVIKNPDCIVELNGDQLSSVVIRCCTRGDESHRRILFRVKTLTLCATFSTSTTAKYHNIII